MQLRIDKYTVAPFAIGLVVIVIVLARLIKAGEWAEHWVELMFLFFGSVCLYFADTVQELTEEDRPHQEWFQEPPTYIRIGGGITMLVSANAILGIF